MIKESHNGVHIVIESTTHNKYKEYISSLCSKINDHDMKTNDDRLQVINFNDIKETKASNRLIFII